MSHKKLDLVQETSTSTGTGALALAGAATRRRAFGAVLSDGDTCYVFIENAGAAEYQVCLATYNASGNTLTPGAVLSSSTGSAVSFSAGTKTISMVAPAAKSIVEDPNGDVSVTRDLAVGRSGRFAGNVTIDPGYLFFNGGGYGIYAAANGSLNYGGGAGYGDGAEMQLFSAGAGNFAQWRIGGAEKMRLIADGLGVGMAPVSGTSALVQTNADIAMHGPGHSLMWNVYHQSGWKYAGNGYPFAMRDGGDGYMHFLGGVSNAGGAGAAYTPVELVAINLINGDFFPLADNSQKLGAASNRWSVVYAGTGTINTSDADEKTNFRDLSETEIKVAIMLARRIKVWQWKDAVTKKGEDSAREHLGVTAQDVVACFAEQGLDPFARGVVGFDELTKVEHYTVSTEKPKMVEADAIDKVVEIIDGEPVLVSKTVKRPQPVGTCKEVKENGAPVPVQIGTDKETGEPIWDTLKHFVPEMETVEEPATRTVPDLDDNGQPRLRMGIRPDQLSFWLLSGIHHRLTLVEPAGTFDALTAP